MNEVESYTLVKSSEYTFQRHTYHQVQYQRHYYQRSKLWARRFDWVEVHRVPSDYHSVLTLTTPKAIHQIHRKSILDAVGH